MAFRNFIIICATFAVALAQSTELQLEAIEAHFQNAELVPVPIPVFDPTAVLTANFQGLGDITPGQLISQDQVANSPNLTLTPANSTITLNGNYTVAMIDPGAVGSDQSQGQNRHWLVNGATIVDNKVNFDGATTITAYAGPAPPAGSGPHRYTIVIYTQGANFAPPQNLSSLVPGVELFDFPSYVKSTNLGPLVAGIYYQVEVGTATASIPATSSVISSTLPAANPSSSGKPSGTSSGSKPTGTTGNTSGAMGNLVSGSLLGITVVLSYIML
ncbi:phosphatidylethanolamine-binding protein [Thelephora terrestris]|uniref:Phosphatidylethanolamine-binding protein n=1 Tax=Thelephora terrestris TaxID=56493 RepID=A0A9P6LC66_9AGAM|nr:phosphatidylethanolamine-binding protein [Thelephora terrestris]